MEYQMHKQPHLILIILWVFLTLVILEPLLRDHHATLLSKMRDLGD